MTATLFIVATPIGNLQDISLRAARTLLTAEIVACEDTRRTGILLSEITKLFSGDTPTKKPRLLSYYDQTELQRIPEIIELLHAGKDVVLVSDAGTPAVSDPGFKLIRECIAKGIRVEAIPGPSSVITALVVSGLPTDRFFFVGYPPKKEGHREEFWQEMKRLKEEHRTTIIFFEAPHRIIHVIEEMITQFGEEQHVVFARELTKVYEEVLRGPLFTMRDHFSKNEPRGEFVILI